MFRIAIAGRQRQGKSLLVNALLGRRRFVPEDCVACTDAIVAVTFGKEGWASLRLEDGASVEGAWAQLAGLCAAGGDGDGVRVRVEAATVTVAEPALEGLTIVDLPGLDSLDPRHRRLVDQALDECDAAIVVTRLEQGLGAVERELLARLSRVGRRVLAVIGNVARHGESDESETLAAIRSVAPHQRRVVTALLGPTVPYVPWNLRDMEAYGQGTVVLKMAHALATERKRPSSTRNLHVDRSR